jgi:K+-sensing histidine kinase KdpD
MRVVFVTFYPAVMLAALYGGLRAGLLASLLSAPVVDYFWIGPLGFSVGDLANWLVVAIFLTRCTMISCIAEATHRARVRAMAAEAEVRAAGARGWSKRCNTARSGIARCSIR